MAAIEDVFSRHAVAAALLDERALSSLRQADPERAEEILEDVGAKGDIRNPSAFVASALREFPNARRGRVSQPLLLPVQRHSQNDVDGLLARYPEVRDRLDASALHKLREADVARATQIVEDIARKGDVRNPSAFVSKSLSSVAIPRVGSGAVDAPGGYVAAPPASLEDVLELYPHVARSIDDGALRRLQAADPERAVELIEELAAKDDVHNVSAFVTKALVAFPNVRQKLDSVHRVAQAFAQYPQVQSLLDNDALQRLHSADPERAAEIIADMALKGDIRNPSAFVSKAISSYPQRRGTMTATATRSAGGSQLLGGASGFAQSFAAMPASTPSFAQSFIPSFAAMPASMPSFAQSFVPSFAAMPTLMPSFASSFVPNFAPSFAQSFTPSFATVRMQTTQPMQQQWMMAIQSSVPAAFQQAQQPQTVESVLALHPHVHQALDDVALAGLLNADQDRAIEIVQDVITKTDIRNVSAFVTKALSQHPSKRGMGGAVGLSNVAVGAYFPAAPVAFDFVGNQAGGGGSSGSRASFATRSVEDTLRRYPNIHNKLDDSALHALQRANQDRAIEIIEDIARKTDVRNPSAFVAKSLSEYPGPRGIGAGIGAGMPTDGFSMTSASSDVEMLLQRYPHVQQRLDEAALRALEAADPDRAAEIIEDIATKGDIRNPSAFVSKALTEHPHRRGGLPRDSPRGRSRSPLRAAPATMHLSPFHLALQRHPQVWASFDDTAQRELESADPNRALEIIEDIAQSRDIRNPSAFVASALRQRPGPSHSVEALLQRYPGVAAKLDSLAVQKLRTADAQRAAEILQEMAAKGDIHNPSAFVVKALQSFPQKRGPQDSFAASGMAAKQPHLMQGRLRGSALESLDDSARRMLDSADRQRAAEILADLEEKGDSIINASAFVASSLRQFPQARGRLVL